MSVCNYRCQPVSVTNWYDVGPQVFSHTSDTICIPCSYRLRTNDLVSDGAVIFIATSASQRKNDLESIGRSCATGAGNADIPCADDWIAEETVFDEKAVTYVVRPPAPIGDTVSQAICARLSSACYVIALLAAS